MRFMAGLMMALATTTSASAQPAPPRFAATTAATAPVADAYFAAYIARNWDALEPLLAEPAVFEDPTALHVFGPVRSEGRTAIMERFRVGYAGISRMAFAPTRRMMSGNVAIYEGALDFALDIGNGLVVESVNPMVIILTVEDGRVVSHRDYVDYAPFLQAVRSARGRG